MKYLKLFENSTYYPTFSPHVINTYNKENLHPNLKFKIGDYVRFLGGKNIYEITSYHTDIYKWYLTDTLELDGYRQPDQFWIDSDDIELVPDYEISAIKYNL